MSKPSELYAEVGASFSLTNQSDVVAAINEEPRMVLKLQKILRDFARICYSNSANHGFWPDGPGKRNKGEQVALIHSEASELLEAVRKEPNAPSEHCPEITAEAEELADLIVRVLDYAHGHNIDIGEAVVAKFRYNVGRPVKHGKRF